MLPKPKPLLMAPWWPRTQAITGEVTLLRLLLHITRVWSLVSHLSLRHEFTFHFAIVEANMSTSVFSVIASFVAQNWVAVCLISVIALLVRNRFYNRLDKYPGPFLASLTDWWRLWDVYKQRPEVTHLRLHAKHGDVVRLGPNCLSFADPEALKVIYGLNKGFVKVGLLLFQLSSL